MFHSVCTQTYENIEHLIIDGGSNDGSLELINKLAQKNLNIRIFSEPDTGINHSTGAYIIFLNSNDYFSRVDAVQLLVDGFIDNSIVLCMLVLKQIIGLVKILLYLLMLTKKELFHKYNNFDENYKIYADYKFILQLICNDVECVIKMI